MRYINLLTYLLTIDALLSGTPVTILVVVSEKNERIQRRTLYSDEALNEPVEMPLLSYADCESTTYL